VAVEVGVDRRVEGRGEDPLVLREQVVGELVERGGPGNEAGRRHDLVDFHGQLAHQLRVEDVAVDKPVARVGVVRMHGRAVTPKVVDADDLVVGGQQLGDQVAADEPGGAGDQDPHRSSPRP
jgi:hypothetical protein